MKAIILSLAFLHIFFIPLLKADLLVQKGELANINSSSMAIGRMSGSDETTEMWWQLFNVSYLKNTGDGGEAFLRYMGSTPPVGLSETKKFSVAQFSSKQIIDGVGTLRTSMWMLGFSCLSPTSCTNFSPMVLKSRNQGDSITFETVWRVTNPSHGLVITTNAISADILQLNNSGNRILMDNLIISSKDLDDCPSSKEVSDTVLNLPAARSPVDAMYSEQGLDGCYNITKRTTPSSRDEATTSTPSQFKSLDDMGIRLSQILVFGFSRIPDISERNLEFHRDVRHWLGSQTRLPIEQCIQTKVPVLVSRLGGTYKACSETTSGSTECLNLNPNALLNSSCTRVGYALGLLELASNPSTTTKCVGLLETARLTVSGQVPAYNVCTNGMIKDDGTSYSNVLEARNVDANKLSLLFSGVKENYEQKHKLVFDLEHGPTTDTLTAISTIVATFLGVTTAMASLTDLQLSLIKLVLGRTPQGSARMFLSLSISNMALSLVCYTPVLLLIRNEIDRQGEYNTWALVARKLQILGIPMQAIIFVEGKSIYRSSSLVFGVVLVVLSMILVATATYRRCSKKLSVNQFQEMREQGPQSTDQSHQSVSLLQMIQVKNEQSESELLTV